MLYAETILTDNSKERDMGHMEKRNNQLAFKNGMRDGFPVFLGYLSVSFALGIAAAKAGLTAFQGMLCSLLNNASAGEYAGFLLISSNASYIEVALMMLATNSRYMLMSCALSQKFAADTPLYQRALVGYDVTDELFSLAIRRNGYLNPFYSYGAILTAMPGWALGTALGILAGDMMPGRLVSALGAALYGMFICAFIPEAKKNKVVAWVVAISFAASYIISKVPLTAQLSDGIKIIGLTIGIAAIAAWVRPVHQEEKVFAKEEGI